MKKTILALTLASVFAAPAFSADDSFSRIDNLDHETANAISERIGGTKSNTSGSHNHIRSKLNQEQIKANREATQSNTKNVADNQRSIEANKDAIDMNRRAAADAGQKASENASDIAVNRDRSTQNGKAIEDAKKDIDANRSRTETNKDNIDRNTSKTGQNSKNIEANKDKIDSVQKETSENTKRSFNNQEKIGENRKNIDKIYEDAAWVEKEAGIAAQTAVDYATSTDNTLKNHESRIGSLEQDMKAMGDKMLVLEDRMDGVVASSHAITNARPVLNSAGQFGMGVGMGAAGSKQAIALGGAYQITDNWSGTMSVNYETKGKVSNDQLSAGVGAQYIF